MDSTAKKQDKSPKLKSHKATSKKARNQRLKHIGLMLGLPLLIYLVFFWIYAGTWMGHFDTRFFADQGDGYQNIWNMWWVNYSVIHLHTLPWFTHMLHYPYGTSLIGQTLNPFNGFVGIFLMNVLRMSLVQSYNTMVVFSFVFGGISMFWLCYYFTKKYIPSLIGGFIFTFSSYHFAHAIGHMQLVSLEWIPLFILLWWRFLLKPRYRTAVLTAVVLLLVLLCDYYYFLYCLLSAGMILIYLYHKKELTHIKSKAVYRPFILFLILSGVLVLPLPIELFRENSRDPLLGAHNARLFSTDLFSMIIDGGFWHFGTITLWYGRHVKAYIAESSVYFSVSALVLLIIAFWKRAKIHRDIVFWIVLGLIFVILSMGPRLMAFGYSINHAPLPYALLTRIFPQLNLSGDPDRFIVIGFLTAAIICAMVLSKLDLTKRKGQLLTGLFFIVLAFELWPGILPFNPAAAYPKYVIALKKLPQGAVIDNAAISASSALYNQTIDQKSEAFGYISRTPTSVANLDNQLTVAILRGQYASLCSVWKIRYITTPASRPLNTTFPLIYNDGQNLIYDLKDSPAC